MVIAAAGLGLVLAGWGYRIWGEERYINRLRVQAAQLMTEGRKEEAEPFYRRILSRRPDDLEAIVGLTEVYYDTDRDEEGDKFSALAEKAQPQNWKDHLLLAYWRLGFRDYRKAEAHLREVIQAQPEHAMARRLMANCLFSRGANQEVQELLTPLLNKDPRDGVTHYLMGKALYFLQQFDEARRHFAAMVYYGSPARPEYRDALYRLIQLDIDFGRLSEARQWLELLVRAEDSPRVERLKGVLHQTETKPQTAAPPSGAANEVSAWPMRFRAASTEIGIDFEHYSPFSPDRYFPESFGAGLAFLDYDRDGNIDLYFVNGASVTEDGPQPGPPNRLFRNLGNGTFEDVTQASGAGDRGFGHGVVVADYNNDGAPDLYILNYGPNTLLANQENGTFRDVTAEAGVGDPRWSCGGAFLDIDHDGDLDLYVSNYAHFDPRTTPHCTGTEGQVIFCGPYDFLPQDDALYRNNGDGTFSEVARQAGVLRTGDQAGRGLGVLASDLNLDGHVDLFVANDETPNFLFLGRGDGTFEDRTETSGVDRNLNGNVEGSMGAEAADLDGDGLPELFVTNYWNQTNTLHRNVGNGLFVDITARTIGSGSRTTVGWGAAFADFDNDGWLDLAAANGHVDDALIGEPYEQPAEFWRAVGPATFVEQASQIGGYFAQLHVGRGLAAGDLENDGDLDIAISHLNDPAVVLINETPSPCSWVRLQLVGVESNRDAIGARVVAEVGDRRIHRHVQSAGSYLSCHDPRLLIGLGRAERLQRLTIYWPNGRRTEWEDLPTRQTYTLQEPTAEHEHPKPVPLTHSSPK